MSVVKILGRVHGAIQEDGAYVLECILSTAEAMMRDRGYSDVVVRSNPIACADSPVPRSVMQAQCEEGGVALYIHNEERVGVKYARSVLETGGDARAIVVSVGGPTSFTKHAVQDRIQFFTAKEMCYNVTRHALVPRHVRVERDGDRLPKLSPSDPVVRYYDWPPGAVIQIRRAFGGHESVPYFRVVAW